MPTASARPPASSPQALARMRRQARRDTAAELAVRRILHRRGLRYRVDRQVLAGLRRRADLLFPAPRVAVFVDGCFWHSCPLHATRPAANAEWWEQKLRRTVERDRETDRLLAAAGWEVIRVWEHEDPPAAAARIEERVRARSRAGTPSRTV